MDVHHFPLSTFPVSPPMRKREVEKVSGGCGSFHVKSVTKWESNPRATVLVPSDFPYGDQKSLHLLMHPHDQPVSNPSFGHKKY